MVNESDIKTVAEKIAKVINAYKVILFGSHARGQARNDSDVDLLIVAESDLPRHKRARQLYGSLNPYPFGMDLLVYTPEEIQKASESPLSFVSEVLREGVVGYAR